MALGRHGPGPSVGDRPGVLADLPRDRLHAPLAAGGGRCLCGQNPAAYTTVSTAFGLNAAEGPPRGGHTIGPNDYYNFETGAVSIPGGGGTATVDEIDPVGRYLMLHATTANTGWGNVSIWELDVTEWTPPPPVIPHAGNEVDLLGWRTTDVVKTLDPDGDNIYGTDGWIRPTGLVPSVNNPSYLTASYIGTGGNASTSSFGDDGVLSGLDPVADIELGRVERVGTVNDMVQLDVTADGSFRVGVMTDFVVLYAGQGLIAGPTAVRVRQTVGGADDTGMITVPVRNSVVDWMFFDILDAEVGDRYIVSVESFSNPWGWSQISHISFDTITEEDVVPEPAGLGLIGLALLAVRKKRS